MKKRSPLVNAKSVGAAISARRTAAGLSQEDVAEQLDIGQEAVSRMERGVVAPSLQRLIDLATVFGCRLDELVLPTSARPNDQAAWLSKQLSGLAVKDREFVLALIDQLCSRLKAK